MGSVCVVFILIALANLSTALMLFGVSILLLIIGRISIKQIAVVCAAGIVLLMFVLPAVIAGLVAYMMRRIGWLVDGDMKLP